MNVHQAKLNLEIQFKLKYKINIRKNQPCLKAILIKGHYPTKQTVFFNTAERNEKI